MHSKSKAAGTTGAASASRRPVPHPAAHRALRITAAAAFVVLATALCARSLLGELWSIFVADLLAPPEAKWSASLMVRHVSHLVAAAGIGLGALWIAAARRRWRLTALEVGAVVLTAATLLSVPGASDKRLAINTALDVIVPLLAAAALYQLLAHHVAWRRALLAVIVAMAAANCWKGSAQRFWEYEQVWRDYQQNKTQVWARLGLTPADPMATIYEARLRARQPVGYFLHANVLASFLLLGLTGTGAALASAAWRRSKRTLAAALVLVVLAAWQFVVTGWIGSAGAVAGLLAGLVAGMAAWLLRGRPKHLAILIVVALGLLQGTLFALAVRAPALYPALAARGGKIKSLAVRLNYWDGAARLFEASPLTGVGPGQFPQRYLTVRPIYAAEDVAHPHNWLLNVAAEYGLIGLIGVLVALGGTGWAIVRSLAQPPPEKVPGTFSVAPLVIAALVVLACWGLAVSDLPAKGLAAAIGVPLAVSLVAMAALSLAGPFGRAAQVILLAGLLAFFVHATVEMTSGVPGATWPFWAMVALAMAWNGQGAASADAEVHARRSAAIAALLVPAVAALAVLALTVRPIRAVALMHQAQRAVTAGAAEQAVRLFRDAAAADPLNPLPLRAAALLRYRLGQADPRQAIRHFREAVDLSEAAVQRDPLDHMQWRSLALARMYLATQTDDFATVRAAVDAMSRALALNPNWPAGWRERARMAAATSGTQPDQPDLLLNAIEALDKALALDEGWPPEDPRKFTPGDRAELGRMREELLQRIEAVASRPTATRAAP